MPNEMIRKMETFIREAKGNLHHVQRVHHISLLLAEKEQIAFDADILAFAAYFHDLAAYPPYADGSGTDHAEASALLMPDMARAWGFTDRATAIITEAVRNHNKAGMGQHAETRLIRNADGLDYLGYMAVARDFSKTQKDMHKAMDGLKKRKAMFVPLIDLPYALELATIRIAELDRFIERFEQESFGRY